MQISPAATHTNTNPELKFQFCPLEMD